MNKQIFRTVWALGLLVILTACTAPGAPTETILTEATQPAQAEVATALPEATATQLPATNTPQPPPTEVVEADPATSTPIPPTPEPEPVITAQDETLTITAADGLEMAAKFYAPQSGDLPAPGVLLLHMLNSSQNAWNSVIPDLTAAGYAVLTVDMRGHGLTGGDHNWELAEADLIQVWQTMADMEAVDETRTAVVGGSIGSNMSLVTGSNIPAVRGVVLLSPGLDYLGVTTEDRMATYGERPVMIVAAVNDGYAASSAETLSQIALGDAELKMYDDGSHGTSLLFAHEELMGLIIDWLGENL